MNNKPASLIPSYNFQEGEAITHCSINKSHVDVRKGEIFNVSLAAVDQIFQPLNSNIQASILSAGSGLAEGQQNRVPNTCTIAQT